MVTFRMAETTITPLHPDKSSNLVKTGIYQYTRNLMYLGLFLILFPIGWFLQRRSSMFVLPIYVWFISKYQIMPEEEALYKLFVPEIITIRITSDAVYRLLLYNILGK